MVKQTPAVAVPPVQDAQEPLNVSSPMAIKPEIPVLVISQPQPAPASVAVHLNGVAVLVSAPTLQEAVDATTHLLAGVRPLIPASGYDYGF